MKEIIYVAVLALGLVGLAGCEDEAVDPAAHCVAKGGTYADGVCTPDGK